MTFSHATNPNGTIVLITQKIFSMKKIWRDDSDTHIHITASPPMLLSLLPLSKVAIAAVPSHSAFLASSGIDT